jgi:hypothetical protein
LSEKKTTSSMFKSLRPILSYEKTGAELQDSTKLEVDKWMASFKKTLTPKAFAKDLEAEGNMLRCLAEPKKPMSSDYKCTMMNMHCSKRTNEILKNEDEQMSKFYQEAGLTLEQLHGQSKIQMAYVPKVREVGEPMVDEKRFNNSTQTRLFHR